MQVKLVAAARITVLFLQDLEESVQYEYRSMIAIILTSTVALQVRPVCTSRYVRYCTVLVYILRLRRHVRRAYPVGNMCNDFAAVINRVF